LQRTGALYQRKWKKEENPLMPKLRGGWRAAWRMESCENKILGRKRKVENYGKEKISFEAIK